MAAVFTDSAIRKLRPKAKRREIADGGAPGLYLVIQPSGAKGWALSTGARPSSLSAMSI
jgi:hypothetical protein